NGNSTCQTPLFDHDGTLTGTEGSPTPAPDPVSGATYYKGFASTQRRNVEGGGRQSDIQHKSLRLLGGVHGDVAKGVSYDASFLATKADMTSDDTGYFSVTRLRRAVDVVADPTSGQPVCRSVLTGQDPACVPWDIFDLGAVSAAAVNHST